MYDFKKKAIPYLPMSDVKKLGTALREHYEDAETRVFDTPEFISVLDRFFNPAQRVIDFGSANGHLFNVLEQRGILKTSGCDIENYLSKGKPKEGFETFDFNRDRYPYEDNTFDAGVSIEVLEHLENPFHFIREVHRVLKEDGIFVFSTPNPSHLFNKITYALREEFYRFLGGNGHIMLLLSPILKKGVLEWFDIVEVHYPLPEMPWRFLRKFKYPANKHFGRCVLYVLRKRATPRTELMSHVS